MRYLRLRTTPDSAVAPELFRLLAASPHATEARLVDWNLGAEYPTVLYSVAGDADAFRAAMPETPLVRDVEVTERGDGWFYLLVTADPGDDDLAAGLLEVLATPGVVVLKPAVYRDGDVYVRMVGTDEALQRFVDDHPDAIEVEVRELGDSVTRPDAPAASLSDRQREAVDAALDLGYYEDPREATQADVADRLGCSPSTAGDHLRKAEAKLVGAAMRGRAVHGD
jgi:predicted DNA binding protein